MTYITVMQSPRYHQITLDELLDGIINLSAFADYGTSNTRTYAADHVAEKRLETIDVDAMIACLREFNQKYAALFKADRKSLYNSFSIPKSSGGLRHIDAPLPALMEALRQLKYILEAKMHALYHTSAFAYIKGRSTVDAVKRHQQNESQWFAKLDFTNFFGSTTLEFIMAQLSIIFPFSEILKREAGKSELTQAIGLCFLNGGLPQGTPISPLLTNLIMIPIDHKISNTLRTYKDIKYVYTRYADDMLISSKHSFDAKQVSDFIENVLGEFNAPFKLNPKKTRYGSRAGSNWNLGIMLNKDNQMTVGHKKIKQFKAMINNFCRDYLNGVAWPKSDVQEFSGLISYYKMIEKSYIEYLLSGYGQKYKLNVREVIKAKLK